ncbi:hypothetical protein QJS04_geneDACA021289 [Acorus gramineus]|uniref:Ultraviolet-B receptor UVR8 n=1 Tax=Acorus gramineus TaxID=55184 RepID=A0AAV9BSA1_ACOGR|nr:hypothetical protein QJS04_geneDACA021289 [Acorus gramineus]
MSRSPIRRSPPILRRLFHAPPPPSVPLLLHKTQTPGPTSTLHLLSWGRGASGQLGGGVEDIRLYPTSVASLLLPLSFRLSPVSGLLSPDDEAAAAVVEEVGISCGLFHSALLVSGRFWIWGKGDGGRLGLGNESYVFEPVLNLNLDRVRSVVLGGIHSAALTIDGEVYTWGYGGFGALGHSVYHRELLPRRVNGAWKGKICQLATSGTHSAAVTDSGELYTWGRDEGDGRLGLDIGRAPDDGLLGTPTKVDALPVHVAAVVCGGFFTMALTSDGQLWSWGGMADDGKVLSWGHGGHGQLGHSSTQNQKVPLVIDALSDKRVAYIACGGSSSAAVTDKGELYMWGNSKDNQLGVPGLPDVQTSPVEVKFLVEDEELGPHHVLSVSIGASHAMCLVLRPGKLVDHSS